MKDKVFLDTNVFIYTQSAIEPRKREISLDIVDEYDCFTSTQVLNEVSNVLTKKLKMKINEVKQIITAINDNCKVYVINYETVLRALDLKEHYGFSYYDSLIITSALENDCRYVFTEDLQDGQIIENSLKIKNIFK